MSVLEGKKILLGVTGSIAAYKSIILLRLLKREGADVQVIFSDSANNFVTQLTFSTLSEKKVLTDFFEDDDKVEWVNHVELAEWADYMIIAPITSSTLSKLVTGNADNLLVATYMSTVCDVFFAPAMDLEMYNSESTKINIKSLVERGNIFIKPAKGYLASGLNGEGRLEEPENIFNILVDHISEKLIYNKKNILVTAGPTHEMIDPVRFISNHSSEIKEIKKINNLSFKILQAARVRVTSTDFISCPSCGRTLFDLQETTAMIRERTDHLKGLKIGIMGCIVNGPGEMADADYGYVGSGVDKITLYRGQEVVKRGINFKYGVDELVNLIKEDGNWIEP